MTIEERRIRAALTALGLERDEGDLGREIVEADAAAELLALAASPVAPSAALKSRILASIERPSVLAGFLHRIARFFELPVERVQELLDRLHDPETEWETLLPGIRLLHFAGGEALATADCGIVAMDPGVEFPMHRHLGREDSLILSGAAELGDGTVLLPGDQNPQPTGSAHRFRVSGDEPLLFAAFVYEGFEVID